MTRPALHPICVVLALVLVAVAGAALAGPAVARAPPQAACAVCTDSLDRAATAHGVAVERGRTSASVRVHANGTSTWTARVELREGADALRSNASLRRTIVAAARRRAVIDDPVALTSRVVDDTLVVTYRARGTSHITLGVVRFDAFAASDPPPFALGGEGTAYPGTEHLTVHAPDGYRVRGGGGDVRNATAVGWRGDGSAPIARDTVLSFVRADALFPGVRAWLAGLLG